MKLMFRNLPINRGDEDIPVAKVGATALLKPERAYAAATPRIRVKIGDLITEALLDTGAEVNVMTRALANRANLPIRTNIRVALKTVSGKKRSFDGACEEVKVSIENIKNVQTIMVVDSIDHKLILGCPFFHDVQLTFLYDEDGYQNARFLNEDRTKEGETRVCRPQGRQDREARALIEEESVNL